MSTPTPPVSGTTVPTQVAYPRRATIRSAFQAFIALCVLVPTIVAAIGSVVDLTAAPAWVVAFIAAGTAGAAIVTRVMAIPGVNDWIAKFVPWLAPEPKPGLDVPGIIARSTGGSGWGGLATAVAAGGTPLAAEPVAIHNHTPAAPTNPEPIAPDRPSGDGVPDHADEGDDL